MGSASSGRLTRLLRPRTLAVVGGSAAARVAEQCDRMGFDGPVWPVHPRGGDRCRPAGLSKCRGTAPSPGCGIRRRQTATRPWTSWARFRSAARAVPSATHRDFSKRPTAAKLQEELVAAAGDMPIIGPNCYGIVNFLDGVPIWPDQHGGRRDSTAARGVWRSSPSRRTSPSASRCSDADYPSPTVVTAGNQAQLGVAEIASHLLDDDRISAVGLHVEGLRVGPWLRDIGVRGPSATRARRGHEGGPVEARGRSGVDAHGFHRRLGRRPPMPCCGGSASLAPTVWARASSRR